MQTMENHGERQNKKLKREEVAKHLLEYQLSLVGKTLLDTFHDDKWNFNITITREKQQEFKKYSIKLIKKVYKCNTSVANSVFDSFYTSLGLRIKD